MVDGLGKNNMKKSNLIKFNFPHKLYILMRNDIQSMNPGKAMAQAAHASNEFVGNYGDLDTVRNNWMGSNPHIEAKRHFGTTIVLAVNYEQLISVLELAFTKKVPCGQVWDETYPFQTTHEIASLIPHDRQSAPAIYKDNGQVTMFRNELTCGYVFVVDGSSNQEELVGHLPLHP